MRVTVRTQGLSPSEAIERHVERRVLFAVGRFGARIGTVSVRLADENGPRGGRDKTCRMVASVDGAGQVVVDDEDTDLYAAVDRAASRFGRAVARAVERRRAPAGRGGRLWPSFRPLLALRDPAFGTD